MRFQAARFDNPRSTVAAMVTSFKLMTANLLNGRADARRLSEVLDRTSPDVVVTQEMGPSEAEVLAARFPHHDLRPDLVNMGRGIATRFDCTIEALELPWRPGLWARVSIESGEFVLAAVHMLNPLSYPWRRSVLGRREQLDALFSWADRTVGDDDPVIVAGDMNATPAWPVYRRLSERWTDLAATAADHEDRRPAATWGWRPGWTRLLRIDHVFGANVRSSSASVEGIAGSDHGGLLVEIELHP